MIDDIKISQTPYLGVSKNLFEFFVIIGYDENMLKGSGSILELQKNMPLTILSNVISDLAYNYFEPALIIKKVYPDKPLILKTKEKPKESHIIFSSCIDSVDGTKKIVNSCYALRFYEKFEDSKNEIYYVPKTFLIYSQYPYFTTYHQICKKLLEYHLSNIKNKIPIEIYIYCFANYIPSPIAGNIILRDLNLNITIPKLTGYPYADFDLVKIFNSVSIKNFIKIYILIYLEIDLLFFSPDLEKLNLFMFILYILNYPLTDSNYFWHIETFSEKDLKSDYYSMITGFKGVNTKYSDNVDLSKFRNVNFIIDLEREDAIIHRKENKESKNIMKLLKYINNILNQKKISKSYFLNDILLKLKNDLKDLKTEYEKNTSKEKASNSFFHIDKTINEMNRKIQGIFYNFLINTLIILNKDLELDPTSNYPVNIKSYTSKNLSDEENIFLQKTRETVKYNTYFDLFIKRFSVSEELKVSLLFIDEFVDLKNKDMHKKSKTIPYFDIIDSLYFSKQNNIEIKFEEIQKEISMNFDAGKLFLSNMQREEKQLLELKKEYIKLFIFQKKNKGHYKSLKRQEETKPDLISTTAIIIVIQNYFMNNYYLNDKYFVKSSAVFIFAITFPILTFTKIPYFLDAVLKGLESIKFFQRYYIFILLKSINKYYIVNQEKGYFSNFNFENMKILYNIIQEYLKKKNIIQNEEIFAFFQQIFSQKENVIEENKINDEEKQNFIYKYPDKDSYMEIKGDDFVTEKHKLLIFKRENEIIACDKLRVDFIFQKCYSLHDYYITEHNFNIIKLDVDDVVNLCINILFEVKKYNDKYIIYHLYNLIPILKNLKNEINVYKRKIEEKKEE